MNEKPNPPKKDIYSYLAVLLFFALFVAGVCGIVSSRTASHEYKNSTCGRSAQSFRITSQSR